MCPCPQDLKCECNLDSVLFTGLLSSRDLVLFCHWQSSIPRSKQLAGIPICFPTNLEELRLFMLEDARNAFIISVLDSLTSYKILYYSYKVD